MVESNFQTIYYGGLLTGPAKPIQIQASLSWLEGSFKAKENLRNSSLSHTVVSYICNLVKEKSDKIPACCYPSALEKFKVGDQLKSLANSLPWPMLVIMQTNKELQFNTFSLNQFFVIPSYTDTHEYDLQKNSCLIVIAC